jgi:hypothetical protein
VDVIHAAASFSTVLSPVLACPSLSIFLFPREAMACQLFFHEIIAYEIARNR